MSARILIVDDTYASRSFMRMLLRSFGQTEVVEAVNVVTACDALNSELHLVLVDYFLPDGVGKEVLQHARARGLRMPIVLVSAALFAPIEITNMGFTDYIEKPFDAKDVKKRISEWLLQAKRQAEEES